MILANKFQAETTLTPIDSIQVSLVYENQPAILVSRDKELLANANNLIPTSEPEKLFSTSL